MITAGWDSISHVLIILKKMFGEIMLLPITELINVLTWTFSTNPLIL